MRTFRVDRIKGRALFQAQNIRSTVFRTERKADAVYMAEIQKAYQSHFGSAEMIDGPICIEVILYKHRNSK